MPEPTSGRVQSAEFVTVRELTPEHFGRLLHVDGWMTGYLYGINDQFHDGYPDRTLTLVPDGDPFDGCGRFRTFTDADPEGYLKTMGTLVTVTAPARVQP